MKIFKKYLWVFLILAVVIIFFYPIFKGQIPFPGDLLANVNPYNSNGYLGYNPGSFPNKAQGPDVIYEIYPWRYFSISQLKQFSIPFWNPYNFSGNPQMADFQTAVFYPFNLIYFVLPFNLAWTAIIMFQPLLAGIFMFLYLKKGLGLKDFPSFVGAVSFGFSSYMSVWMEYGNIGSTLLWLPLILYLTKVFVNKRDIKFLLGLIASFSFAILAGYIQGVFYIYILCLTYYIYLFLQKKEFSKNLQSHIIFLVSLVIPFLLTAFQILPTIHLFVQSTRGAYSLLQIEKSLAPLISWVTIFIPDFFGNPATRNYWIDGTYIERVMYPGSVILFFVIYFVLSKKEFLEKKFFLILSIISLLIATNLPLVKYFYLIPIPVISTTIPTREFSIFIFSLVVLGSVGVDIFLKEKVFRKKILISYLSLFVFLWAFVLFFSSTNQNLKISQHNLILPTVFAVFIAISFLFNKKNQKISIFVISAVMLIDLFYFFNKITPFSASSLTYPDTSLVSYLKKNAGINRFWGYGSAYIPSNFQSVDQTFSPEGNDPLHISSYGLLLSTSGNGLMPVALPRPDANIAPGYGQDDLKNNFYRKRILDLLGVKYIIDKKDDPQQWYHPDSSAFPKELYSQAHKVYPWIVYQNNSSIPRFFVSPKYILAKNKAQVLSFIYNPNVNLANTIILQSPSKVNTDIYSKGSAKLILYKPNKVVFQTSSTGNSLLFLSDNFYSEWSVKVDGRKTNILLADYTFRAVSIPRGKHTVEFVYNPVSFSKGVIISVGAIVFSVLFFLYVKKFKKT